jgi:hypothetical protein
MNNGLESRNWMWEHEVPRSLRRIFRCEAKTAIHVGEVAYSDHNIPVAQAINEVFKIEKRFRANELGITEPVRISASAILRDQGLTPRSRGKVILPGARIETELYVIDRYRRPAVPRRKRKT